MTKGLSTHAQEDISMQKITAGLWAPDRICSDDTGMFWSRHDNRKRKYWAVICTDGGSCPDHTTLSSCCATCAVVQGRLPSWENAGTASPWFRRSSMLRSQCRTWPHQPGKCQAVASIAYRKLVSTYWRWFC